MEDKIHIIGPIPSREELAQADKEYAEQQLKLLEEEGIIIPELQNILQKIADGWYPGKLE